METRSLLTKACNSESCGSLGYRSSSQAWGSNTSSCTEQKHCKDPLLLLTNLSRRCQQTYPVAIYGSMGTLSDQNTHLSDGTVSLCPAPGGSWEQSVGVKHRGRRHWPGSLSRAALKTRRCKFTLLVSTEFNCRLAHSHLVSFLF